METERIVREESRRRKSSLCKVVVSIYLKDQSIAAFSLGTVQEVDQDGRIELTVQLWGRDDPDAFEEYLDALVQLLPRTNGVLERRIADTDPEPAVPDAVLVVSFPDSASVDGWLRDPLRSDLEDLAQRAVTHSLITDSRHRRPPTADETTNVVLFQPGGSDLVQPRKSPIHGTGVFALVKLDQGALVGRYSGAPTMLDGKYVLWIEGDDGIWEGIDGAGDLRFVNHSRSPNVEFDGPELYALRDVNPGEELLFDYGEDWSGTP